MRDRTQGSMSTQDTKPADPQGLRERTPLTSGGESISALTQVRIDAAWMKDEAAPRLGRMGFVIVAKSEWEHIIPEILLSNRPAVTAPLSPEPSLGWKPGVGYVGTSATEPAENNGVNRWRVAHGLEPLPRSEPVATAPEAVRGQDERVIAWYAVWDYCTKLGMDGANHSRATGIETVLDFIRSLAAQPAPAPLSVAEAAEECWSLVGDYHGRDFHIKEFTRIIGRVAVQEVER